MVFMEDKLMERLAAVFANRTIAIENEAEYLSSAVLVPLIKQKGEYQVLFEVRSANLNRQPGEICFPGGRIEAGETPLAAAVQYTATVTAMAQPAVMTIQPES